MKNLEGRPIELSATVDLNDDSKDRVRKNPEFQAFKPINCETDGIEIGAITDEKFEFCEQGDRIVGLLVSRQTMNMKDNPILYHVTNDQGEWAFFGSTLIDNRLMEVPNGVIIDITYLGDKFSRNSGSNYKNYLIRWYPVQPNFDPAKWRVSLSPDGKAIDFVECKED